VGRLDGKIALITGAGAGIGRAAALLFAAEGARVTLAEIAEDAGRAAAQAIARSGSHDEGDQAREEDERHEGVHPAESGRRRAARVR